MSDSALDNTCSPNGTGTLPPAISPTERRADTNCHSPYHYLYGWGGQWHHKFLIFFVLSFQIPSPTDALLTVHSYTVTPIFHWEGWVTRLPFTHSLSPCGHGPALNRAVSLQSGCNYDEILIKGRPDLCRHARGLACLLQMAAGTDDAWGRDLFLRSLCAIMGKTCPVTLLRL